MINLEEYFSTLPLTIFGNHKRLNFDCKLKVFYGLTEKGYKRFSFLSTIRPFTIDSTKSIEVIQMQENDNLFWTCFDLHEPKADLAFYSICEDLLQSIQNCNDELSSLKTIKNRFDLWKKILSKSIKHLLTEEIVKGLYGELYFLKNYMIPKYGEEIAIKSWGGPDGEHKDFSTTDSWFEIKTTGSEINSIRISSLSQLDSDIDGELVVIKVEKMSEAYNTDDSSAEKIVTNILRNIENIEIKDLFISKLTKIKYTPLEENIKINFKVNSLTHYLVNDSFPRIKHADIKFPEIDNITYSLYLKSIEPFRKDEKL